MLIEKKLYNTIREIMPTFCVDLVITNSKKEFLLIKRTESPAKGQWWLPGGRVHKNETIRESALRKAKEELDINVNLKNFVSLEETIFKSDNVHTINAVFHAVYTENIIKLDKSHSEYTWTDEIENSLHPAVKNPIKIVMERL